MWRSGGGARRVFLGSFAGRCGGGAFPAAAVPSSAGATRPFVSPHQDNGVAHPSAAAAAAAAGGGGGGGCHPSATLGSAVRGLATLSSNGGPRDRANDTTARTRRRQGRRSARNNSDDGSRDDATVRYEKDLPPDIAAISEITYALAELQHRVAEAGLDDRTPIWRFDRRDAAVAALPDVGDEEEEEWRREMLERITVVADELRHYVLDREVLRPDGRHRHEFSAIVERLMELYWQCSSATTSLYPDQITELLDLMRQYRLDLNHRQCDLAVQIAAREGRFREAARLYAEHIDPDQSGYTPAADPRTAVAGLYCTARAAAVGATGGGGGGVLPVERVLEGVLSLSLVSPSDTEKCKKFATG